MATSTATLRSVDILYVNTGVGNEALLVNGNCGQAGNLDEDAPIRETSSPVVAVDRGPQRASLRGVAS